MARPIRVEFPDAVYHVTARGNERQPIVREDPDRERFLETLEQMVQRFGVAIHAYCLMLNYHLLLQTPRANLSAAVGWFQTTYSVRFNRRHRRSGHLYQGRFKAHLVEADGYARQLVKEIRWRRRADGDEVSRLIASLVAQEADRRVAIWLRVRVGGQRMTELAKEYGYRDGSGIHRVVHRLEQAAKEDRDLAHRLQQLADRVSSVKS